MGIGSATILAAKDTTAASAPVLRLVDVDEAFTHVAATKGSVRSVRLKPDLLSCCGSRHPRGPRDGRRASERCEA